MECNCVSEINYTCHNCEGKKIFNSLDGFIKINLIKYWNLTKTKMNNEELKEYSRLIKFFDEKNIDPEEFDFDLIKN